VSSHEVAPPAPPTTAGIVGFPANVDVVGSIELASKSTERPLLRGIVASGVRPDGTVDLSRPGGRIRYVFGSARGEGPLPPRPPGTLPARSYCGKQSVHLRDVGLVADPDQPSFPCPGVRGDALPAPRCGPREVWEAAKKKGAPAELLATIEYFRSNAGPAWRFEIPGTAHTVVLYGDCARELSGSDAIGTVP